MDISTSSYSYGTITVDVSHLRVRDIAQVKHATDPVIREVQDKACAICHDELSGTIHAFLFDENNPAFFCSTCEMSIQMLGYSAERMTRAAAFFSRGW